MRTNCSSLQNEQFSGCCWFLYLYFCVCRFLRLPTAHSQAFWFHLISFFYRYFVFCICFGVVLEVELVVFHMDSIRHGLHRYYRYLFVDLVTSDQWTNDELQTLLIYLLFMITMKTGVWLRVIPGRQPALCEPFLDACLQMVITRTKPHSNVCLTLTLQIFNKCVSVQVKVKSHFFFYFIHFYYQRYA